MTKVTSKVETSPAVKIPQTERYMDQAQRDHFRKKLENWRAELMQGVDVTLSHLKEEHESCSDEADQASKEETFWLELRTRDRERRLLKKISQSLEAIHLDDYGYCEDCGMEIGVKRLEARPTATKCVDCKTISEIKEKQTQC